MAPHEGLAPLKSVRDRYDRLVRAEHLHHDPEQERVADRLDALIARLAERRLQSKSSALGWLFARRRDKSQPLRGLYLHGGVGRGKTMLMDIFFDVAPVERKRRTHFNEFMADVHDRISRHRAALKAGEAKGDDPIPPVAAQIVRESWLICFDEFAVTDIADAMILSRLFSALFERGAVLVATSNVAPRDLYRDGLNRALFTPFIDVLEAYTDVLSVDIDTDYRLKKLSRMPVWVTPLGEEADEAMETAWDMLLEGREEKAATLTVKGRKVAVPRAAGDAARFTFAELCEAPLGARDYLALAGRFSTIVLDRVPVMSKAQRNPAKRFILLIDTFYDRHVRLFASAASTPDALYTGDGTEAFEFRRTASRLIEMQGKDWAKQR